jgi:hypothetical protein
MDLHKSGSFEVLETWKKSGGAFESTGLSIWKSAMDPLCCISFSFFRDMEWRV